MKKPNIHRINDNENYTLENCKFIEKIEHLSKHNIGEKNSMAKLSDKQVKEIRKLYTAEKFTKTELSKKFNISYRSIVNIVNYRSWKHLK